MSPPDSRTQRFDARLSRADKELLDRAAELSGRSLTDFVLGCAREAAERTIARYEGMVLVDTRDRAAFVDALLKPRAPSRRLRQAAQRYKRHTAG